MIGSKVTINDFYDEVEINFSKEKIIFKRIFGNYIPEGISFGLFKVNGIQIGESFCRADKWEGAAWYLDNIETFKQFERKGFGSLLLEETCKALLIRTKADIVLARPGNNITPDGFDRKSWYERHGFEAHPDPKITFMWRKY
jgi:GNAT superfamily N-acetyltransferase